MRVLYRDTFLSKIAPAWREKLVRLELRIFKEAAEDSKKEEYAASLILRKRVERVKKIACLCAMGSIVKNELIAIFPEEISRIIISFIFCALAL